MNPSVIVTLDPATGEELAEYRPTPLDSLDHRLRAADAAQRRWARSTLAHRAAVLTSIADGLRENLPRLAETASKEMGKPIVESRAEVEKCATACDHYAKTLEEELQPIRVDTDAPESWYQYDPLGVILAIMPWNFPYWQIVRVLAPALAVGNGVVLKHSPNVTGCALALADVVHGAGVDPDLFQVLLVAEVDVPFVVEEVIRHGAIAAVTVTGSNRAGAAVASSAGRHLKPSVLELGGSDPFIVLEDADVDAAVQAAVRSRFLNGGQSCLAAKRFIVVRCVAADFTARFIEAVGRIEVGDPLAETTDVGPLAREDLRHSLAAQVERSVGHGAQVLAGGHRLDRPGFFYAPTVVRSDSWNVPILTEETFGPVAAVVEVGDEVEAIALANSTQFGLAASVWTGDIERVRPLLCQIESGAVFVNTVVASDVRLPFGGVKASGYGRELGVAGLRQFSNIKTYVVGDRVPAQGQAPSE